VSYSSFPQQTPFFCGVLTDYRLVPNNPFGLTKVIKLTVAKFQTVIGSQPLEFISRLIFQK
jgi:hypothetical protein